MAYEYISGFQIERTIDDQEVLVPLTEDELRRAYDLKRNAYLKEDFQTLLIQRDDFWLTDEILERNPGILIWCCNQFDILFDANLSHNDLLELTINHLQHNLSKIDFQTGEELQKEVS